MKVTQPEKAQLVNNLPNQQRNKPKPILKQLRTKSLNRLTKMYSINYEKLPTQRATELIKTENGKRSEFSNLMRFSTLGLKLLFAKDLLSFFSDLPSKKPSNKSQLNHPLDKSGKPKGIFVNPKTSKEKFAAEIKKEFNTVEKLLKTIDNQLPKNEKEIKSLLSQMQKEVREFNTSLMQMPKIRLQVIYLQVLKLKSQLEKIPKPKTSERLTEKGGAFQNLSIKSSSFDRKVLYNFEMKDPSLKNADSNKMLKHLNNLHISLTQLSKVASEKEMAAVIREVQHMFSLKSLFPLGIVYPFTNFKLDRSSKKKKKTNREDLPEEEEYQEDDSSLENKK